MTPRTGSGLWVGGLFDTRRGLLGGIAVAVWKQFWKPLGGLLGLVLGFLGASWGLGGVLGTISALWTRGIGPGGALSLVNRGTGDGGGGVTPFPLVHRGNWLPFPLVHRGNEAASPLW